jgi:hypothetical protein
MDVGMIPIWGQWGLLGLSVSINLFLLTRFAMGLWVSRAQLEQVQKVADTFQQAWSTDQQTKHEAIALTTQLTITAQTMEKVLNALPQAETARVIVSRHEEGS